MLGKLWFLLLTTAFISACLTHQIPALLPALNHALHETMDIAIILAGTMAFWLGLISIAKASGWLEATHRALTPLLSRAFPDIPPKDPALEHITTNCVANLFGLGNAATPAGLKAMESLARISNQKPHVASDAMCFFLALNTSSLQLIPITGMAILSANGALSPGRVIIPTLLATSASTLAAILFSILARQLTRLSQG